MPCDLCRHPNKVHKKMTSTIYFCEVCNVVESLPAFTADAGVPDENESSSFQSTSTKDLLWQVRKNQGLAEQQ